MIEPIEITETSFHIQRLNQWIKFGAISNYVYIGNSENDNDSELWIYGLSGDPDFECKIIGSYAAQFDKAYDKWLRANP